MMERKLILGAFAAFMFCTLSYGAKPTSDETDEQAASIVADLHSKANLSAKQQDNIRGKAKEYTSKLKQARAMSNKEDSYSLMKNSEEYYKMVLDTLLTTEQKDQIAKKEKAQREEIIKVLNTKYNK